MITLPIMTKPPDHTAVLPSPVAGSGVLDRLVDTARAYAADWAQFTRWCRRRGAEPLPPSPELIGLYLADLASPSDKTPALSVASVLAGIRRRHARPPKQKEAILAEDILAMIATLPRDLRGLRDRALLLVGLDLHKDDTPDSRGWVQIFGDGALLTLNAKTGWREVEIGRGSSEAIYPLPPAQDRGFRHETRVRGSTGGVRSHRRRSASIRDPVARRTFG